MRRPKQRLKEGHDNVEPERVVQSALQLPTPRMLGGGICEFVRNQLYKQEREHLAVRVWQRVPAEGICTLLQRQETVRLGKQVLEAMMFHLVMP